MKMSKKEMKMKKRNLRDKRRRKREMEKYEKSTNGLIENLRKKYKVSSVLENVDGNKFVYTISLPHCLLKRF